MPALRRAGNKKGVAAIGAQGEADCRCLSAIVRMKRSLPGMNEAK